MNSGRAFRVIERAWRALSAALLLTTLGCSSLPDEPAPRARSFAGASNAGGAGSAGVAGGAGMNSGGTAGAAVATTCATGQIMCGGRCVDPQRDSQHCGACDAPCTAGSVCQSGACQLQCATGQAACAGACKTIVSDPVNCGGCGVACSAGQFCAAGTCSATCSFMTCPVAGVSQCADPRTNPSHCGACGMACAPGQSCVEGSCVLSCPTGLSACNGACVNLTTNAQSCGACGMACPNGTPCIAGHCGCPTGQTLCQGACVDTTSTAAHCGGCGKPCVSGQSCEAGACRTGCSTGLTQCGASCVNTGQSLAHCGGCDRACAAGQSCAGGVCTCPNGGTLCGSTCADLQADEAHCGTCAISCAGEQTCTLGMCACPNGLTACGTACVDTTTSNAHCGGCNESCQGGSTCMAGECRCPANLTLCGGSCVDNATSAPHCGACDAACATGQTCLVGMCSGAGGVGADGCTGGLARSLTVSRIDAFQTVAVGIMEGGDELTGAARNTDLVQGRETVFRIFVTLGSGWSAREISARVTLVNGTTSEEHFTKKTVSQASSEDNAGSTFQVSVPAEEVGADTRYYVELVECGTPPSGEVTAPRFPSAEDAALGARETGLLKVTIIPITANSMGPDTSEAGLEPYKKLLEAIYPVTGVELTIGGGIQAAYPIDWNDTLDAVRAKRSSDRPASDVYYYGLLKPVETFREFCGRGCTAGIGFVTQQNDAAHRVAMGIGFDDLQSPHAMAHELGHNHGRNHAPCVPAGSSISGVDGNFPYEGANIGVWGYDNRSDELIDPEGVTDMMGYCDTTWVSDYTYDALVNRVAGVNGAKLRVNPDILARFRVLLVDAAGPRWGRPITELTAPSGVAEIAEIRDANATVVEHVVVYRTEVSEIAAASILVPEPEPGWHSVQVSGAPAQPF